MTTIAGADISYLYAVPPGTASKSPTAVIYYGYNSKSSWATISASNSGDKWVYTVWNDQGSALATQFNSWDDVGKAWQTSLVNTISTREATPTMTSKFNSTTSEFHSTPASTNTGTNTSTSTITKAPKQISKCTSEAHKSYSQGAAAGIGVGSAIAGALVVSAIFFFCFRGSRRRRPPSVRPSSRLPSPGLYASTKPSALTKLTPVDGGAGRTSDIALPQPTPDSEIAAEMSKLRVMIKNHVQSFYNAPATTVSQTSLVGIIERPQISISELAESLAGTRSRQLALRYVIASVVFSRIGLNSDPGTTFLPPDLMSCLRSLETIQTGQKGQTMSLNRWRVTTAAMLQQAYRHSPLDEEDPRFESIYKAVDLLEPVLLPLATHTSDTERRRRNLEEIFKRAAAFGFLLFCQSSTFVFDWKAGRSREPGGIVIWPALIQTTDGSGQPLHEPRVFEHMELSQRLRG